MLMTPALEFRRISVQFLARSEFFFPPKYSYRFWGLPSHLFKAYRWLFAGGKAAGTWRWQHTHTHTYYRGSEWVEVDLHSFFPLLLPYIIPSSQMFDHIMLWLSSFLFLIIHFFHRVQFRVTLPCFQSTSFVSRTFLSPILHETRKRKANWIGHILRRNCLLQQVIEGKIKGQMEVTRRRGRRRKKLLADLKVRRGYCQFILSIDTVNWRRKL